jgi:hypothetical protein
MSHHFWKPFALAVVALALTAVGPAPLHAQDRPDEHHDQMPAEHHDAEHHDDQRAARPDYGRPDPAVQYRHEHPNASARCHDGFFTTTRDRGRACTKHGGIDIWLVL